MIYIILQIVRYFEFLEEWKLHGTGLAIVCLKFGKLLWLNTEFQFELMKFGTFMKWLIGILYSAVAELYKGPDWYNIIDLYNSLPPTKSNT